MTDFQDRDGKPMTLEEWSLQMNDDEYRRVDFTTITSAYHNYEISTVWIGILPNQLFETMVFSRGAADVAKMNNYMIRCDNLIEAERQHGSTVYGLQKKLGLKQ